MYYSASLIMLCYFIFFFFSSRRRHTRYIGDWSSDVCSSDLKRHNSGPGKSAGRLHEVPEIASHDLERLGLNPQRIRRSEERRVGKGVDLGGSRMIKKKKER